MNALNRQATGLALALCRDALGNMLSGQDERTLGYLQLAIRLLSSVEASAESKGDVRAEQTLRSTVEEVLTAADNLQPAFDHSISGESVTKWAKKGFTPEASLTELNVDNLPEDHPLRQLVKDLSK